MNHSNQPIIIKVENINDNIRVDKFLEIKLNELGYNYSRNQIQKNIDNIKLNNRNIKKKDIVTNGDTIIFIPPTPKKISLEPENKPIDIVYQDKDIIVINKPKGMVVHPAKGNYSGTLINALLYHVKDFQPIGNTIRPGVVHRLDKDTSGLMVLAKNELSHQYLVKQFKNRQVKKIYHCIVKGILKKENMIIENNIGRHQNNRKKFAVIDNGKYSKTRIEVIKRLKYASLLKVQIFTGRTHQIRVHMQHINHPILGDPIYSRSSNKWIEGLALVSKELSFIHPIDKRLVNFNIEYPQHFHTILKKVSD